MKIKNVAFDLMYTIANTQVGQDRFDQYATMFKENGLTAPRELIQKHYGISRKELEKANFDNVPEELSEITTYAYKWGSINAAIIRDVAAELSVPGPDDPLKVGLDIYQRLMGDPSLFVVRDEMRKFLRSLINNGINPVLATNQELALVQNFLAYHNLCSSFDEIIVSDAIGCEKPTPGFYNCVLDKLGVDPYEIAMVGNNPENDLCGAYGVGITKLFLLKDEFTEKDSEQMGGIPFVWGADPIEFIPFIFGQYHFPTKAAET